MVFLLLARPQSIAKLSRLMTRMPSSQVEGPIPWSFKFGRVLPPVHLRHRILVISSHPSPMGPATPAFRLVRPLTKSHSPYICKGSTHVGLGNGPDASSARAVVSLEWRTDTLPFVDIPFHLLVVFSFTSLSLFCPSLENRAT